MEKKTNDILPPHLKELVNPTPSGIAKLTAVWDGLSTETQMLLLSNIKCQKREVSLKFLKVAIKTSNPYIRYLIVKMHSGYLTLDEDNLEKKK